jgi:hypothetical protein
VLIWSGCWCTLGTLKRIYFGFLSGFLVYLELFMMYVHAMFDCFTDFVLKLLEMKVLSGFARCLTWV